MVQSFYYTKTLRKLKQFLIQALSWIKIEAKERLWWKSNLGYLLLAYGAFIGLIYEPWFHTTVCTLAIIYAIYKIFHNDVKEEAEFQKMVKRHKGK